MKKPSGINMEVVRKKNRATIFKYINDHGPTSRKDLADAIGLTAAALTQICGDMVEEGFLREVGQDKSAKGAGRKQVLLDINAEAAFVLTANIEPKQTTIAIANLKGELVEECSIETNTQVDSQVFLQEILRIAKRLLKEHQDLANRLQTMSIGITGLVDKEQGISKKAYGLWNHPVDVKAYFEKELGLCVLLENNVNAFATAEMLFGKGREDDNLMVIKWGPGVGCAMVIERKIYEGSHSKAAELGHFIVERNGKLCSCGRKGCLETKVSYGVLQEILPFTEDNFGEIYQAFQGSAAGDRLQEAIVLFARSIVNSATIMAPNYILLTGSLFHSEVIRKALILACKEFDETYDEKRILYSALASQEGYIGPLAVWANRLLFC